MKYVDVFDVSAIVHTGNSSSSDTEGAVYQGYRVGGMHYFFRLLSTTLASDNEIVLCFDSRSIKKDKYPEYKAGRTKKPEVTSQIASLYEELKGAGIPCYKCDGVEADDIISWAVLQNRDPDCYDEIRILGNDYDLTHNVQPGVTFKSICKNTNTVTYHNFETSIVKSKEVMYNTISFRKALMGDGSDNIKALKFNSGVKPEDVYVEYCKWLQEGLKSGTIKESWDVLTNPVTPLHFCVSRPDIMSKEEIYSKIIPARDLTYPIINSNGVKVEPVDLSSINVNKLGRIFKKYGDHTSANVIGAANVYVTDFDVQDIRAKAKLIETGAYAADNNLQIESPKSTDLRDIDAFQRRFN